MTHKCHQLGSNDLVDDSLVNRNPWVALWMLAILGLQLALMATDSMMWQGLDWNSRYYYFTPLYALTGFFILFAFIDALYPRETLCGVNQMLHLVEVPYWLIFGAAIGTGVHGWIEQKNIYRESAGGLAAGWVAITAAGFLKRRWEHNVMHSRQRLETQHAVGKHETLTLSGRPVDQHWYRVIFSSEFQHDNVYLRVFWVALILTTVAVAQAAFAIANFWSNDGLGWNIHYIVSPAYGFIFLMLFSAIWDCQPHEKSVIHNRMLHIFDFVYWSFAGAGVALFAHGFDGDHGSLDQDYRKSGAALIGTWLVLAAIGIVCRVSTDRAYRKNECHQKGEYEKVALAPLEMQ